MKVMFKQTPWVSLLKLTVGTMNVQSQEIPGRDEDSPTSDDVCIYFKFIRITNDISNVGYRMKKIMLAYGNFIKL